MKKNKNAMLSFLKRLLNGWGMTNQNDKNFVPHSFIRQPVRYVAQKTMEQIEEEAAAERTRIMNDFPETYQAAPKDADTEPRPDIFEPALRHFARAFRKGEPAFADEETRRKWHEARLLAMDHLLNVIGQCPWRDFLVLRGSLLLFAYGGDAARTPGDMDFVFLPTYEKQGADAPVAPPPDSLFETLIRAVVQNPSVGNVRIIADEITTDEIWTYERAEGRRIVFPWIADGLPPGEVQMDMVFNEPFFAPPVQVTLPPPFGQGKGRTVWAADKPLSLAWKLLWLQTDSYPQGKDLYDAVLLAEHMQTEQMLLPFGLLYRVLQTGTKNDPYNSADALAPGFPLEWDVDWANFQAEYPHITGDAQAWQARLDAALAPTYADAASFLRELRLGLTR